jgi:hypothetical protein
MLYYALKYKEKKKEAKIFEWKRKNKVSISVV